MSNLDTAIALACKIHAGQVDKAGQPYILHPLRLMHKFQDEDARIASVLHDVIEDGDLTLDKLREYGFSEIIVDAIECLTRRPEETYENFIHRLSSNALAKKVKIEDIQDNLDITRLQTLSDKDLARITKYHQALRNLLNSTA